MRDILKFSSKKLIHNPSGYKPVTLNEVNEAPIINNNYLMYVSRLEHPGKNHINLIKAFIDLPPNIIQEWKLVLVGADWPGADEIHQFISQLDSYYSKKIVRTGFVTQNELENIYCHANIFIFPSLYEGFGLPVLDAMARGVPVLCSNTSSLPEIAGDAAIFFNPLDNREMRTKIEQIILNKSAQQELIEKGYENIKNFEWDKHFDNLLGKN